MRYGTRLVLLAMIALTLAFLLSEKLWEQILLAIASAVRIFLTRTLLDGIYRGLDRVEWAAVVRSSAFIAAISPLVRQRRYIIQPGVD